MDQVPAKVAIVAGVAVAAIATGYALEAFACFIHWSVQPRESRKYTRHKNAAVWFQQLSAAIHLPAENKVTFASFPYYLR